MGWRHAESGQSWAVGAIDGGRIAVGTLPPREPLRLTPAEARELALELQAAAERIDPQPPPKPRGAWRKRGRGN